MHPRAVIATLLLASFASSLPGADDEPRWRVHAGMSSVAGLEIGCPVAAPADPSTAPLTDRDYDDGFNRVDATNNLGDGHDGPLPSRTGYFAFERDDQVDLAAGTLALSSLSAATDTRREAAGTQGINIGVRRDFRPAAGRWHCGLSADIDWHGSATTVARYDEIVPARRLVDRYQLGGVVPQLAPYTGHYTPQPGDQRIGDMPSRSITTADATLSGTQTMEHEIAIGRLGLWCDRRLGDRVALSLEGGLAAARCDADVVVSDTLAAGSGLSTARAAGASGSVTPLGWFAGLRVHVALSPRWGLSGACSLLDLGEESDGGVTFDASALTVTSLQLTWRF